METKPKKNDLEKDLKSSIDEAKQKEESLSAQFTESLDTLADLTKSQIESTIKTLEERRAAAEKKLQELREASSNASEDIVIGTQMAWNDLKDAINSATSRF